LVMRRLLLEIEALSDRAELIVLPPPCPQAITPIDFSHTDELIRRGYESTREYLDGVGAPLTPRSVGVPEAELGEPVSA
jgi:hypothetical protein